MRARFLWQFIWLGISASVLAEGVRDAKPSAQEVVVLPPGAASIPPATDLREMYKELDLEPKSQGARGSCTIFGTLGVMEFRLRKQGQKLQLSEQFAMWATNQLGRYKRGYFACEDVIAAVQAYGVCREELMPYKEWGNVGKPSKEALADAATRKGAEVTWFHRWNGKLGMTPDEVVSICRAIADGSPVTATFEWPRTARLTEDHFLLDRGSKYGSGHVVVLVGYELNAKQKAGGAFTFRQSWGDKWGDGGYAKLTFEFAMKNAQEAYALELKGDSAVTPRL